MSVRTRLFEFFGTRPVYPPALAAAISPAPGTHAAPAADLVKSAKRTAPDGTGAAGYYNLIIYHVVLY